MRNVTERKRVEGERERFFTLSLDMLCIAGFDGYFKRLNPAWERTLGFRTEELLAKPYLDFVHVDDRAATISEAGKLSDEGVSSISFENRYLCKDGSYKWLQWNATPFADQELIYAVARDITESKRADEALRKYADEISDLYNNAPCGYHSVDKDGTFVRINDTELNWLGYSRDEIVGKMKFSDIIPPETLAIWKERFGRFREHGWVRDLEFELVRKDGTTFPVLLNATAIKDADNNFVASRSTIFDITERKLAEDLLERRAQEVARSNAELEEFAYVVSHDLKEPLRAIEAFSTFLAEDYEDKLDEQGHRYVSILRDSAIRMRDLIEDLLDLSRLGRVRPQFLLVSAASLVEEVRDEMAFGLKEAQADLHIQPGLPTLTCDPIRIKQVFKNLISNAIKYNDKPHPVIEIGCHADDSSYAFFVRDNGPGIDPKYHEKIFRIFQRLVHREERDGTGIGLAICKKIVEGHGGKIWVESGEAKAGSTFLFNIPKALEPSKATKEE